MQHAVAAAASRLERIRASHRMLAADRLAHAYEQISGVTKSAES